MRHIRYIFFSFVVLCLSVQVGNAQTNAAVDLAVTKAVAVENKVADQTIKVKVKGVGCSRDCKAISYNVAKIAGVSHCKTLKKGATTTFEVTYNPGVTTEKAIYAAVENTAGCSKQADRPYKVKL